MKKSDLTKRTKYYENSNNPPSQDSIPSKQGKVTRSQGSLDALDSSAHHQKHSTTHNNRVFHTRSKV